MKLTRLTKSLAATFAASTLFFWTTAQASLVSLTQASFGAPKVTFSEVALGTPLNGLTINGFNFGETVANTFVTVGGPLDTNTITQPSALGSGNPAGQVITVTMPGLTSEFGFAYALLAAGVVADGVAITLFDGINNLGGLVFSGAPDPTFPGGFVGIGSTIAFDRAQIVFNSSATAYDFDNISANAAVPEPASLPLVALALGLAAVASSRRKQAK